MIIGKQSFKTVKEIRIAGRRTQLRLQVDEMGFRGVVPSNLQKKPNSVYIEGIEFQVDWNIGIKLISECTLYHGALEYFDHIQLNGMILFVESDN